ncbi:hypothetical protein ARMGADRAFT_817770 [Armillaria gallica]|uniref:Uncharacterized protein n=1 Tax=Armillaria gallica TaxID=47427 RepID=A0A2H3CCZ6_ARMGA|nr:hypothetical protein ARMGADRAFT_817770 [Armillaria gallica]
MVKQREGMEGPTRMQRVTLLSSSFRHQHDLRRDGRDGDTFDYEQGLSCARDWVRLPGYGERTCARFDCKISTFELSVRFSQPRFRIFPLHTPASVHSLGSTSARQFQHMSPISSSFALRGGVALVSSPSQRQRLRCWSDITTLSLGTKKPT